MRQGTPLRFSQLWLLPASMPDWQWLCCAGVEQLKADPLLRMIQFSDLAEGRRRLQVDD
jgi:hypothetical protein